MQVDSLWPKKSLVVQSFTRFTLNLFQCFYSKKKICENLSNLRGIISESLDPAIERSLGAVIERSRDAAIERSRDAVI